jgi:hypothetical protein
MLVSNNQINMRSAEWSIFKELTFAPWRPRTVREFNAMAELGAARHMVDNTDGIGWMHALSCEEIKFGPNGEVNFPIDKRRMEYVRVHGTWPSDEELRAFSNAPPPKPGEGIRLVGSKKSGSAPEKAD